MPTPTNPDLRVCTDMTAAEVTVCLSQIAAGLLNHEQASYYFQLGGSSDFQTGVSLFMANRLADDSLRIFLVLLDRAVQITP